MSNNPFRIDIHHHINPEFLTTALEELGVTKSGNVPMKKWKVQDSLAMMDRLEVKTAIVGISEPGINPLVKNTPDKAAYYARKMNEYMADMHEKYPDRFGGFAVLPLPRVEESLKELAYALDVLKLDGVGLLSNYEDSFLGDPEFDVVFNEINKRKGVVYIHPSTPGPHSWRPKFMHIDSPLEFIFCTTRALANLIFSGTLERYRDIQIIPSHAGGVIPYLKFRLDEFYIKYTAPELQKIFPSEKIRDGWLSMKKSPSDYMAEWWYDNCTATSHIVFEAVKDICGSYRMMYGSDFGFASELIRDNMIKILNSYGFTEQELYDMERGNAEKIFPRFKA